MSDTPGADVYRRRREMVFLVLAGLFLGTLAMLNLLGISRFLDLSFEVAGFKVPFVVAVGVLPYPITFLCTDLLSELYGFRRANQVVKVGLLLNLWVVLILWLGGALPGFETMDAATGLPAADTAGRLPVFFEVKDLALSAVAASMVAYLSAQFCDVWLYHFWKNLTKGKHLWLRNNGSTLVSQLVDSTAVILITYYFASGLPVDEGAPIGPQLMSLIFSGYLFKAATALLDTGPMYLLTAWLTRYLGLEAGGEVPDLYDAAQA